MHYSAWYTVVCDMSYGHAHQGGFGAKFEKICRTSSVGLVPRRCESKSKGQCNGKHHLGEAPFVEKHHHCCCDTYHELSTSMHHTEHALSKGSAPPVIMTLRYISRQSQKKNSLLLSAVNKRYVVSRHAWQALQLI